MIRRSNAGSPESQDQMLSKIKSALHTYKSASQKYLGAVKALDSALEGIAVSFRELSQGDLDESVRRQADALCSAIDAHMSANRASPKTPRAGADMANGGHYSFPSYISDFSQQITTTFALLKDTLRSAEKTKLKRDEAVKKYQKLREDADAMETKLARKNQGISDSTSYQKKIAKRDAAKALADTAEEAFSKDYDGLMAQRASALSAAVNSMGSITSKYYSGLAKIMRAGVDA